MPPMQERGRALLCFVALAVVLFAPAFFAGRLFLPLHTDQVEPWRSDAPDHLTELDRRANPAVTDQVFLFDPGAAQFLEARGDDDGRLDALPAALFHDPGDQRTGHDDNAQVHGIGNVQDRREGLDAHDAGRPGVDRVDHPGIPVGEDVGKDRLADAAGPAAGADDRH